MPPEEYREEEILDPADAPIPDDLSMTIKKTGRMDGPPGAAKLSELTPLIVPGERSGRDGVRRELLDHGKHQDRNRVVVMLKEETYAGPAGNDDGIYKGQRSRRREW